MTSMVGCRDGFLEGQEAIQWNDEEGSQASSLVALFWFTDIQQLASNTEQIDN